MEERLKVLYRIPEKVLPQDVYLQDLAEQCAGLETRVRDIMEGLPAHDRQVPESYPDMRDELEYQTVKTALRFSKNVK
ncbi:MAG: hypothetical protein ACI4PO_09950 [Faecousia sp.]